MIIYVRNIRGITVPRPIPFRQTCEERPHFGGLCACVRCRVMTVFRRAGAWLTLADREDELAAVAVLALLTSQGAACGIEAALLGAPDRSEVPGVDFEQDLAEPKIGKGPGERVRPSRRSSAQGLATG